MTRASRHFQNVNQVNTSKIKSIFSYLMGLTPIFSTNNYTTRLSIWNVILTYNSLHLIQNKYIYIYMLSPPHPYFSNCTNTKCSALWLSLLCIDRLGTTLCLYRCIMLRCEWNTIDNRLVTSDQSQLCVELSCNALHFCCNASYALCNFT